MKLTEVCIILCEVTDIRLKDQGLLPGRRQIHFIAIILKIVFSGFYGGQRRPKCEAGYASVSSAIDKNADYTTIRQVA